MNNNKMKYQMLIRKYLKGICTYDEKKQLLQWISDREVNEKLFIDERKKWETVKSEDTEYSIYIDQKWNEYKSKLTKEKVFPETSYKDVKVRKLRLVFRYAALFILLIGFSSILYLLINTKAVEYPEYAIYEKDSFDSHNSLIILSDGTKLKLESKESHISYNAHGTEIKLDEEVVPTQKPLVHKRNKTKSVNNQLIVPNGRQAQLTLSDGTKVWLNAGSRLVYPAVFTSDAREVFIEGEAFFDVTKDINKPFIVKTKGINIRVFGTSFNVMANSDDDIIETVLVSGKVQLEKNNTSWSKKDKIILHPGQSARFEKESLLMEVKDVNVESYITWKEGWYKLGKLNLLELSKKLERYYDIKIIIQESEIEEMKLFGKLDLKEDIKQVFNNISAAANIEYKIENDTVMIFKKDAILEE